MKQVISLIVIFALFIALTPIIALLAPDKSVGGGLADPAPSATVDPVQTAPATEKYEGGSLVLLDEATGQTLTVTERDYVIGAVLCEMPALYEIEALKAQAVAAHTYALFVKQLRETSPLIELQGASFTVNTATFTGYMSKAQAKSHFGNDFDAYYTKIEQAVDAVMTETLQYDGRLISACYHAISPGRTENSENVFASSAPYLTGVDSSWDTTAEKYETTVDLTASELNDLLRIGKKGFETSGDPATWLGDRQATEAGTVTLQNICGVSFTGVELRTMLALRSAAFDISYANNTFTFKVRGYGHGVGLSQYGANCMAKEGKTYAEILAHYYQGAVLVKAS